MQAVTQLLKNGVTHVLQKYAKSRSEKKQQRARPLLHMWNLPILFMAFLLGRAMIMGSVAPFAIAYLAVVFHLSKKQWPFAMAAISLGVIYDFTHAWSADSRVLKYISAYSKAASMDGQRSNQLCAFCGPSK